MELTGIAIEFNANGFAVARGLLDPVMLSELLAAFRVFSEDSEGLQRVAVADVVFDSLEGSPRPIKYLQHVNGYLPLFNRLFGTEILDTASVLLAQPTFYDGMELHDKAPHGGTITPPHQDNFYFCLDPPDAVTAYVPLEPHGPGNGGLHFVRHSHRGPLKDHFKSKVKAFSSALDESDYDAGDVEAVDLAPGDVVFHHAKTIHFAPRNDSDRHRRSVSIRINGVHARVSPLLREGYLKNFTYNRA